MRSLSIVLLLSISALTAQAPPKSPPVSEGDLHKNTQQDKATHGGKGKAEATKDKALAIEEQASSPKDQPLSARTQDEIDINRNLAKFTGWLASLTALLVVVGFLQLVALTVQARALIHHSDLLTESVDQMRQAVTAYQGYIAVAQESNALTREATALTRQSLILTQRPRLVVRNVLIREPMPPLQLQGQALITFDSAVPVIGQFSVVNVGGTPAEIRESECAVFLTQDELPMQPPYEGRAGNNPVTGKLAPGESRHGVFETPPISKNEGTRVFLGGTGGYTIYVLGWIEYLDDLTIVRRTVFCRRYDIQKRRFRAIKDADYEHAE